jgi:amino acid adenylation domain-containing protein
MKTPLLHQLPGLQAAIRADAPCLELQGRELEYGELERESGQLANLLLTLNLQAGDRVGIYLPKSFETVISMIGILKAGGVYVPMDPLAPASRAALISQDCEMRYMITTQLLFDLLQKELAGDGVMKQVIVVGEVDPEQQARTAREEESSTRRLWTPWRSMRQLPATLVRGNDRREDDLAYVLYTSGSTGRPKGVMISHRNALAFIDWACREFRLCADDRLSNHAPFHFDLAVFDLYAALFSGARMSILTESVSSNPRRMLEAINSKNLTVWYSVPSALILMLEQGGLEQAPPLSLRAILFAGEEFPLKYLKRLMTSVPGADLYNLYGPTETNVCTSYRVKPEDLQRTHSLPIGRPCSGDVAFVLNDQEQEVQPGETGELWIEGPTVMLGYWSSKTPPSRSGRYPTGDLVSHDEQGDLVFHGRKDLMVKIRGFRVELREVEIALNSHLQIREAGVVIGKDELGANQLIALVVPASDQLSVLDVKKHCSRLLPYYMVPHRVRFLEELKKTSTGKVDRVALSQEAGPV